MYKHISAILTIVIVNSVSANELGCRGQTFKIEEQPFQEMVIARLAEVDLEKEKEKMHEIAREKIENPKAVESIERATADNHWYYDPTYELDEDVVLPCGKILHKAGTKVNPLDYMDLERRVFFINGKDKDQIAWLKENIRIGEDMVSLEKQDNNSQDLVILVAGSPIELSEELGIQVYFDQNGGVLTSKWHITKVPAIVEQEGKQLRIEEIKI